MNQQNIQPNLAAGFQNNAPGPQVPQVPQVPQMPRPRHVNLQTVPPEIIQSVRTQLLEQMNGNPQGPMQPNPVLGPEVVDDAYNLFGFSLQRKYVYIIVTIFLLVVGYYLWKWYNARPLSDDEDDDESEYDEDLEFDGMLGYPDMANQQNKLMQQQLMQQQLMQQQMMQRKLAEQQQKKDQENAE